MSRTVDELDFELGNLADRLTALEAEVRGMRGRCSFGDDGSLWVRGAVSDMEWAKVELPAHFSNVVGGTFQEVDELP